jgi:thymidylate synthase (FAD)
MNGVAKECARMILPLTTETTIYMTGSARSWLHYLELRCDTHTQLEHREIANAIKNEIFIKSFPNTSKALGWV